MKSFVKKYRFFLILVVLVLAAVGALASMSGKKQPERTTLEECRSLLADPETNGRLTAAASILQGQKEFNRYLFRHVHPYNSSLHSLEELKNDMYFAQEEQSAMLEAFSLLKGLTMIKYDGTNGDILNIELAGENYSRIKMFFLPHAEKDPEAALLQEEYLQAAYYEIAEVDENWYIGVHKPDKA
ncbi:MAG: hypothetical protein IKZ98_04695 [Clostridia bacterium]|nr:hypothetical protein [Clostridia bacterium]